jgi:hypothetical protein
MKTKIVAAIGIAMIVGSGMTSCQNNADQQSASDTVAAMQTPPADTALATTDGNNAEEDYVLLYAVIADTGYNYFVLNKAMYNLSAAKHIPVDTMGRHYDPQKKKIVLSDTDEDEMYRGEYFPRRFPSSYLSMEYYATYTSDSCGDVMALCAGLFENEAEADSVLTLIKPAAPRAYKVAAKMYLGCMH